MTETVVRPGLMQIDEPFHADAVGDAILARSVRGLIARGHGAHERELEPVGGSHVASIVWPNDVRASRPYPWPPARRDHCERATLILQLQEHTAIRVRANEVVIVPGPIGPEHTRAARQIEIDTGLRKLDDGGTGARRACERPRPRRDRHGASGRFGATHYQTAQCDNDDGRTHTNFLRSNERHVQGSRPHRRLRSTTKKMRCDWVTAAGPASAVLRLRASQVFLEAAIKLARPLNKHKETIRPRRLSGLLVKHAHDFVTLSAGKTRVRRQRHQIAGKLVRSRPAALWPRAAWREIGERTRIARRHA